MIVRVVETFTGMALVYFLACLFTSSINEWIAQKVGRRGLFLNRGLQRLIPEQAIYRRLLHHPLISGLYREQIATGHPPSYIAPENFALALVDVIHARSFAIAGTPPPTTRLDHQTLRDAIIHLRPDHPNLAQALLPVLDRAGTDYEAVLKGIEAWFSAGMDRVSGWYQAKTRGTLFVLGLGVAVVGNIDSLALARSFWMSPAEWNVVNELSNGVLAAGMPDASRVGSGNAPPPAMASGEDALLKLKALQGVGVPLGLDCLETGIVRNSSGLEQCVKALRAEFAGGVVVKLLGWLLTALAISLGAPFWYEALSRIVSLRASGPKPAKDAG